MASHLSVRPVLAVGFALGATVLTACGGADVSTPEKFDSERAVPDAAAWDGTDAIGEDAWAEFTLDDDSAVALWIDPDDIATVLTQRSDTTGEAWTEPTVLAEAGDGCLLVAGASDGKQAVAATLYCYEKDAFIEQAPDQAYGVVTTDGGASWHRHEYLELTGDPTFDGDEVVWDDQLTWSESDGFVEQ